MSLSILIPLFAAIIISLLYHYIFHPLFFSPLRRIPAAHPVASFTALWITYHRRHGSQALPAIKHAHSLHGPIIRLSPTELSVSSLPAIKRVYIEKGGFAKPKWWAEAFKSFGVLNMVSMQGGVGSKEHAARKRDLGNVYAKSVLMGSERLKLVAKNVMEGISKVLESVLNGDGVIDMYGFNGAASTDFVSAYVYGNDATTDFLGDVAKRDEYYRNHGTWLKGKPGHGEAQKWLESFGFKSCGAADSLLRDEEKGNSDAVVYKQLHARGLRGNDIASETLDHFVAGAEAPRTALTYLQWELSKHKHVQTRLRIELRELLAESTTRGDIKVPDFKTLDSLPLLDAVLTETMRLYAPAPGPQHRITPIEGTTLHGFFIPGGTQISASTSILHHNASVFPDPDKWNPDRWLTNDKKELEEMHRWFWAFGKGSRVCIGKDFTLITMKLVVAAVYSRYETEVVEDDGMEQEDLFLAGPVSEKLVLRLRSV